MHLQQNLRKIPKRYPATPDKLPGHCTSYTHRWADHYRFTIDASESTNISLPPNISDRFVNDDGMPNKTATGLIIRIHK